MPNKWHLEKTIQATSKIVRFGLERFADIAVDEIDSRAPGGIKGETKVIFGLRRIRVVNDHRASAFVEFGTPPHVITPKTKTVLRWVDEATGAAVFAKRVNHPGTDPNPFMRNGIKAAVGRVAEAFR